MLPAPTVAVSGDAAAMSRGSLSRAVMSTAARVTGCSRNLSPGSGGGTPTSMRMPSTSSPPAPRAARRRTGASACQTRRIGRVGAQFVLAGLQLRRVDDRQLDLADVVAVHIALRWFPSAGARGAPSANMSAPAPSRRARAGSGRALLRVDGAGHRGGHLAEQELRIDAGPRSGTAAGRQCGRRPAPRRPGARGWPLSITATAARVGSPGSSTTASGLGLLAQHQALAATDEDAERAVVGRHGA